MSDSLHEEYCLIRNRRARYAVAALFLWFTLSAIGELGKTTYPLQPLNPFRVFFPTLPWVSTVIWLSLSAWMIFAFVPAAISLIRECESRFERMAYGALAAFFVISFGKSFTRNDTFVLIARNIELSALVVGFLASWQIVLANPGSDDQTYSNPKRGILGSFGVYVAMVLIATLGSAIGAITVIQFLSSLARLLGAEAFAKQLSSALIWPFSPFLVTAGAVLGFFTLTVYRTRAALWVWIGPSVLVGIAFASFRPASIFQSYWPSALSHYFGLCSGDCNDRLLIAPFLASAAFAAGALLRWKMRMKAQHPA